MIEVLLLIGFTALLGGGIFTVWRKGVTSPRFHINPELDAPEPRSIVAGTPVPRAIEASVRAELDSTPEWWDSQFHRALKSSGAPVLAEIEGDIIEEYTFTGAVAHRYELPGRTLLEGCTCADCRIDNI